MSPLNRGSGLFVPVPRGSAATAAPPPGYHISPLAGALISAGIRPQGIPYKLPFIEFLEMPSVEIPLFIHAGEVRRAICCIVVECPISRFCLDVELVAVGIEFRAGSNIKT